jgi:hypothetical protein
MPDIRWPEYNSVLNIIDEEEEYGI